MPTDAPVTSAVCLSFTPTSVPEVIAGSSGRSHSNYFLVSPITDAISERFCAVRTMHAAASMELEALARIRAMLADVRGRFDRMDQRFDGIDRRFDALERELANARLELRNEIRRGDKD